jgi:hypothetical protein
MDAHLVSRLLDASPNPHYTLQSERQACISICVGVGPLLLEETDHLALMLCCYYAERHLLGGTWWSREFWCVVVV